MTLTLSKFFAVFAAVSILFTAAGCTGILVSSAKLVENSDSNIEIILPPDVRREDAEAANILAREISKLSASGRVKVSFFKSGESPKSTRIFLKKRRNTADITPDNLDISAYGKFEIIVAGDKITIEYPDKSRALNAVGIFLRKLCGMDFYAPSEIGTHFKKHNNFSIPAGKYVFYDSFASVGVYTLPLDKSNLKALREWQQLNGVHFLLNRFSHNLNNIFDAEFMRKYPEMVARKRNGSLKPWAQPDILNPIAAPQAAKKAEEFFVKNPDKKMFSVGINDSSEFDERPRTLASKDGYFRGYPNYSKAVFEFSSKAAKLIAKSNPTKFVGCIAYLSCEKPPEWKLPKNLIPYFTTDRANYFDGNFKELDFKTLKDWGDKTSLFGIYDYAYGSGYVFPRAIEEYFTEGIAHAYEAGARAYYVEINPFFAYDAQKCAAIFAALENPENPDTVSETLDKFYDNYYGVSGLYIKKFFAISENTWKAKRESLHDATRWLSLFKLESSNELFADKDISQMQTALNNAADIAKISKDKKYANRVRELELTFDFGKSVRTAYLLKKQIFESVNAGISSDSLIRLCTSLNDAEKAKENAYQKLKTQSLYPLPAFNDFCFSDILNPSIQAAQYLLKMGINSEKLKGVFTSNDVLIAEKLISKPSAELLQTDGGFENVATPPSDNIKPSPIWLPYADDYDGHTMLISRRAARTGNYGIEFSMCENSAISRTFNISENQVCLFEGWYRGSISAGTACYATIAFFGENNKYLGRKTVLFNVSDGDKFLHFVCAAKAPPKTLSATASLFASRMKRGDFLYADDLKIKIFNNQQ